MKADCPKCGSPSAWYEKTATDLTIRCLCGCNKLVFTTLTDGITIEHRERPSLTKLPKPGTRVRLALQVLAMIEPATSKEVTDRLNAMGHSFSVSDVSSYLAMLRAKTLVEVVEARRGIPGGSTWELTSIAQSLLGI